MRRIHWAVAAACGTLIVGNLAHAGLLVSEKEVRREARVEWLSMKRHVPLEPNRSVQKYVECVADAVIAELEPKDRDNVDWEVVVFDDDAINAGADPNGKILVFSGLLKVADTPDALAAVLGHEIAHMTQSHVMDRARKSARTNILVMLGSAATGIRQDILGSGATIGFVLPYARDQETQADLIGLQYMAKAGFDPRSAIYLWKNMSASNTGNKPAEIVADHPADDVRMENIVKSLRPALVAYNEARAAGKRPNCEAPPT